MRIRLIMFTVLIASMPSLSFAQLLSERVDGRQRVCTYAPVAGNLLSDGQGRRVHRTGFGENCPATFPATRSDLPVPPTARLRQEASSGEPLVCVYEQGPNEWALPMPESGTCPLYAGMVPERRGRGQ